MTNFIFKTRHFCISNDEFCSFRATWHPTSDRVFALGRWPETKSAEKGTHGIDLFTVSQASAGEEGAAAYCTLYGHFFLQFSVVNAEIMANFR